MTLRLCLLALAVLPFAGCQTLPPEKVRARIHATNANVRRYVAREQQEIELRIAVLSAAVEALEARRSASTLRQWIARDKDSLRLGREIVPELDALEAWAEGREPPAP